MLSPSPWMDSLDVDAIGSAIGWSGDIKDSRSARAIRCCGSRGKITPAGIRN